MPISPATVQDYFYRSVSNSLGSTNTGEQWKLSSTGTAISSNTRFAVNENSTAATIKVTSGETTAYHDAAYADGGVNGTYQEVLMKFTLGSTSTDFGILMRRTSNNSFYAARLSAGNSVSVIVKNSNLASPFLAQVATASFTSTAGTAYWMRFRTETNNNLRVRVWAATAAEPSTWNVDTAPYTGSQIPTTGRCGIWWRGNSVNATHKVHQFYAFDSVTYGSEPALPVTDNFSVSSAIGFGRASVSGHQWRGSTAEDPQSYGWGANFDSYVTSGDGFGTAVLTPASTPVYSFIGPDVADSHVTAKFNFSNTQQNAGLLVRASPIWTASTPSTSGYLARIGSSDTLLRVYKIVSGTQTQIASFNIGAMTTPVTYQMRLQVEGTKVSAKAWIDGNTEPNWQVAVTDSAVTGSGCGGIYFINGTSAARTYKVYSFSMTTPLVVVWTGDASLDGTGDLSISPNRIRLSSTTGISASGNTVVAGQKIQSGQFGGSSASDLTAVPFVQKFPTSASASLDAQGFFVNASAMKQVKAVSALDITTNITVATRKQVSVAPALSADSAIVVAARATRQPVIAFTSDTVLSADAIKDKAIGVSPFSATATLVAGSAVGFSASAVLSGRFDLRADANDFRVDMDASGTLIANSKATINAYIELSADASLTSDSSKATTQFGQAAFSVESGIVTNARSIYLFATSMSALSGLGVETSRLITGSTALSSASNLYIESVSLTEQYDHNLRYMMQLFHKRAVRSYPRHTSVVIKQLAIALPTSAIFYAIVKDNVALEFGSCTITWGGVVNDASYTIMRYLPSTDGYAYLVNSVFPAIVAEGVG